MTSSIGSGLGSSVGIGKETTYGTGVAPTRWLEFESETLAWTPNRSRGAGLYNGGMFPRASQRATTTAQAAGDIVSPVYTKGMGFWLAMIFGTMGITPTQQSTSTAYLQTHVLANNYGQSTSIQVGRPSMDGTVNPYTYTGCKVTKAVFEAKVNEPLRLTTTVDSKDVSEVQTYTAPSYQTPNAPLFWHQGNFQMGAFGSEAPVEAVRSFTLTIERGLRTDNFYMDGTGRKKEPVMNAFMKVTGELETDFLSKAAFADIFSADTPQSIIMPFTGGLIASSYNYALTLSMPHCRFDSGPPNVAGPDIIQPKMQFDVEYDDTNAPFTCTYMSTDATL